MIEIVWQLWARPSFRRTVFFLLLFGIPLLLVRPVISISKAWRAETCLKRAQAAMAKRDWDTAHTQALLAQKLRPNSTETCRLLARIGDAQADAHRLALWSRVLQTRKVTDADRLAFARIALQENLGSLAQQQLTHLMGKPSPGKEACLLAGLIALHQKHLVVARESFQKALSQDPAYAPALIGLARTELVPTNEPDVIRQGIRRITTVTSNPDEDGLQALRILIDWGRRYVDLVPFDRALADQLRRHPMANVQDYCLATEWEISHLNDPKRINFAIRKLTMLAPQLSPRGQYELAVWLNRQKQYQQTLHIFPRDPRAPEDMILVQLDAMAALGMWAEIEEFLKNDLFATQPMLLHLYRARAAKELHQEKDFDANWKKAVNEAGPDPRNLHYLATYAEDIGENARSAEIYQILSRQPGYELDSLVRLVHHYEELDQTRPLLETLERLGALQPDDLAISNDIAYLGLLLNEPRCRSQERAQQVYTVNPLLPAFVATYALSLLKNGYPEGALRAINNTSPDTWTAPGWQAVHAAVLAANGRKKEAVQLADRIDTKSLKSEEKQLLATIWQTKTKPTSKK